MGKHYLPNTGPQRRQMLQAIGVGAVEDLFSYIPEKLRFSGLLNLPDPIAEPQLVDHMEELAGENNVKAVNFLGGGIYDHYIPAAIDHVLSRSEFYTLCSLPAGSQPGTLQAILILIDALPAHGAAAANASL